MIRRKYLLLFVMSFTLLLVGCDNDLGHQSPNDEWIAETLVSEVDVEHSGVDAWFYSEAISDQIFSRMWLKSWKEDCPLNRSELRYLKVLHRNADGNPQRGEMVVNAAIEGGKVILSFEAGTDDLMPVAQLKGFALAGTDGRYKWAEATVEGNKVVVWSEGIAQPTKVRYAWDDNPQEANLKNKAGLPASPFQMDVP